MNFHCPLENSNLETPSFRDHHCTVPAGPMWRKLTSQIWLYVCAFWRYLGSILAAIWAPREPLTRARVPFLAPPQNATISLRQGAFGVQCTRAVGAAHILVYRSDRQQCMRRKRRRIFSYFPPFLLGETRLIGCAGTVLMYLWGQGDGKCSQDQ